MNTLLASRILPDQELSKGHSPGLSNTIVKWACYNQNIIADGVSTYVVIYDPKFFAPIVIYTVNSSGVPTGF